jgi:hypothetical protein
MHACDGIVLASARVLLLFIDALTVLGKIAPAEAILLVELAHKVNEWTIFQVTFNAIINHPNASMKLRIAPVKWVWQNTVSEEQRISALNKFQSLAPHSQTTIAYLRVHSTLRQVTLIIGNEVQKVLFEEASACVTDGPKAMLICAKFLPSQTNVNLRHNMQRQQSSSS